MSGLVLTPNIPDADGFYAELIAAHEGLSESDSAAFNARLLLILCNHVGDRATLAQAFDAARAPVRQGDD